MTRPYIINSPHVISEVAAVETVVINLETGTYYNMNEAASALWAYVAEGVDIDALKKLLCQNAEDENAFEAFFEKLIAQGLVKPCTAAPALPAKKAIDLSKITLEVYTDMQDLLGLDPIHEVEAEAGWPVQKAQ